MWQKIETAPRDGALKRFKCANGTTYIAPALPPVKLTKSQQLGLAKEGHWPDHKNFRTTHWRALLPGELYVSAWIGAIRNTWFRKAKEG